MPYEPCLELGAQTERSIAILAAAFEIDRTDVIADVGQFLTSRTPRDELLVSFCGAHRWGAEMGVVYLAHLARHVGSAARPMQLPAVWQCT